MLCDDTGDNLRSHIAQLLLWFIGSA